jgi:hypothetical protein
VLMDASQDSRMLASSTTFSVTAADMSAAKSIKARAQSLNHGKTKHAEAARLIYNIYT